MASHDGIQWVVPAGVTNPLVAAPAGVGHFNRDPELLWDGTKLVIYYTEELGYSYRITSTDGVTWTAPQVLIKTATSASASFGSMAMAYYAGDGWYLWNSSQVKNKIERWFSSDGINWTGIGALSNGEYARHDLAGMLWHLSHFEDAEGHHFMSSAFRRGGQAVGGNAYDHSLYYGFSQDGKNIHFDPVPLLQPTLATNNWMGAKIYRASMVRIANGMHRVYFSAMSLENTWGIGYVNVKLQLQSKNEIPGKSSMQIKTRSILVNGELRDIATHYVNNGIFETSIDYRYIDDWNFYQNHVLAVRSSLDQDVALKFSYNVGGQADALNTMVGGTTRTITTVTIPKNGLYFPVHIGKDTVPFFDGLVPGDIAIFVQSTIAPTTGNLNIDLIMWN